MSWATVTPNNADETLAGGTSHRCAEATQPRLPHAGMPGCWLKKLCARAPPRAPHGACTLTNRLLHCGGVTDSPHSVLDQWRGVGVHSSSQVKCAPARHWHRRRRCPYYIHSSMLACCGFRIHLRFKHRGRPSYDLAAQGKCEHVLAFGK